MKLHPKQELLLSLLEKNQNEPLTLAEMVRKIGASSNNLVLHHLKQLEKKGYLKRNPYNPSDYQILTTPENPISYINFYGKAQCGREGCFLDGTPEDRIPLSSKLINFKVEDAFMVKAAGDSMEPNIYAGDLIIARKKYHNFNNHEVVVCSLNGEAIIKEYVKDNSNVLLKSFNKKYPPIFISEDCELFLVGKVEQIIKNQITF
jgi:repressor LexA